MARPLQQLLQTIGRLDETGGPDSAREKFRAHLRREANSPELLKQYTADCGASSNLQCTRALQDIINHIGELLGFKVIHGRYHSDKGPVTIDGHWRSQFGHQYLVEICGVAEPLPESGRMRNFARLLHMAGKLPELDTIIGIYVANKDRVETGVIQKSLLKSLGKPAMRVASVDALIRLYELVRGCELSHGDIDHILAEGGVDIDSSILALWQSKTGGEKQNASDSALENNRQSHPNQPSGAASRPRSMEEVKRLLEEIKRAENTAAPKRSTAETSVMAEQDSVTRKKEIHISTLPPQPHTANVAAPPGFHVGQATAAAVAENSAPGFNATLNDTRMNMMPELPEGSWRKNLTKTDEQMFDSISGTRKKPFINIGLGRKDTDKLKQAKGRGESSDGLFSGIFSGLTRSSKSKSSRNTSVDHFEQVTVSDLIKSNVDERTVLENKTAQPELYKAPGSQIDVPVLRGEPEIRHDEHKPEQAVPAAPVTSKAQPQRMTGKPAALEAHDALTRIVARLWPYPEFRDYAVDVFSCGAKAHNLARDEVEELLFLVELHGRRK